MPVAIQLLEFKSQAEMSHVPQPQEALQFGWDPGSPGGYEQEGAANAVRNLDRHYTHFKKTFMALLTHYTLIMCL